MLRLCLVLKTIATVMSLRHTVTLQWHVVTNLLYEIMHNALPEWLAFKMTRSFQFWVGQIYSYGLSVWRDERDWGFYILSHLFGVFVHIHSLRDQRIRTRVFAVSVAIFDRFVRAYLVVGKKFTYNFNIVCMAILELIARGSFFASTKVVNGICQFSRFHSCLGIF